MTEQERKELMSLLIETAGALASPNHPETIAKAPLLALRLVKASKALHDAQPDPNDPEPPLPF